MSITFSPGSGSTINFGSVPVGSSANQTVSVTFHSPNSSDPGAYFYATDTSAISGPQASMFTGDMFDSFYGPGNDGSTHVFRFSPSAIGAATATLNWTYHQATGSDGLGFPGSGFYNLSGTGVNGPPPSNPNEVAAMTGSFRELLVPSHGLTGNLLSYFDSSSLDDANDGSTLIFKAEDINFARVPTIRRVAITYIDLGVATITVNISGVNDQGALVQSQAVVQIGTVGATGNILTAFADLSVSCFRPQLKIIRNALGGPVYLVSVMPLGMIEDQSL